MAGPKGTLVEVQSQAHMFTDHTAHPIEMPPPHRRRRRRERGVRLEEEQRRRRRKEGGVKRMGVNIQQDPTC